MTNWLTTETEHSTEYALVYQGRLDLVVTGTRAEVEEHIARGIRFGGIPASDYGIAHRAVVRHPWAPTTYSAAEAEQQAEAL